MVWLFQKDFLFKLDFNLQISNLILNIAHPARRVNFSLTHQVYIHLDLPLGGGALVKILIGMLVSFFGFEIYENVTFWVSLS